MAVILDISGIGERGKKPELVAGLGGHGIAAGRFINPTGGLITNDGSLLYISDSGNHRIQVFSLREGRIGTHTVEFGTFGTGEGEFRGPGAIDSDQEGNLYILDVHNQRVQVFSPEHKFLRQWGGFGNRDGQFNMPLNISIDREGKIVYVLDAYNYRVQAFDTSGRFLFKWGSPGADKNQFMLPFGLVAGVDGNVYVTDSGAHKVKKFDAQGTFITEWGRFGSGTGEFYKPKGIAQDGRLRLYVIDFGNHRGQVFDTEGRYISEFGMVDTQPTVR